METVQIVPDKKLPAAADCSQQEPDVRAEENRDCEGYLKRPQTKNESQTWETEAVWPKE